jgi:periplasmic divalent cation tolerance protein
VKIVFVTAPAKIAEELAAKLVGERLAACGTVIPGAVSVYRWKGAVERAEESQILLKTSDSKLSKLMRRVRELHPYDVPEIVAVAPARVSARYATWVAEATEEGGSR